MNFYGEHFFKSIPNFSKIVLIDKKHNFQFFSSNELKITIKNKLYTIFHKPETLSFIHEEQKALQPESFSNIIIQKETDISALSEDISQSWMTRNSGAVLDVKGTDNTGHIHEATSEATINMKSGYSQLDNTNKEISSLEIFIPKEEPTKKYLKDSTIPGSTCKSIQDIVDNLLNVDLQNFFSQVSYVPDEPKILSAYDWQNHILDITGINQNFIQNEKLNPFKNK